jgi:hypothetical protein
MTHLFLAERSYPDLWLARDVPEFARRLKDLGGDPKAEAAFIDDAQTRVEKNEKDARKYEAFIFGLVMDRSCELEDARERRKNA